jgi:hypothetical protein
MGSSLDITFSQVADAAVAPVEALGIYAVQLAHAQRKVGIGGFEQQVVMVAHQAIGMADPAEAADDLTEHLQKQAAVFVVEIDVLPGIASGGDVVERTGEFESERAAITKI